MIATERKRRDEPLEAAWTVSIASIPGESSCPELDKLDKSLKKTRDQKDDPDVEIWKQQIVWPNPRVYGPPLITVAISQLDPQLQKWLRILEEWRHNHARIAWQAFEYTKDDDADSE